MRPKAKAMPRPSPPRRGLLKARLLGAMLLTILAIALFPQLAWSALPQAADQLVNDPLNQAGGSFDPGSLSGAQTALRILVMMTALSLLPSLVLTVTCFTRIIIVFSFLRQALGIQGMPPNQILVGMALFLSIFIMAPTATRVQAESIAPYSKNEITMMDALHRAKQPVSDFMLSQTSSEDLRLFLELSGKERPQSREEVPFYILAPAFILSEVRIAFQMGFLVLLPFMIIDLVVSSVLMAMGMMMLPPALIALPLKVMVFVLADGWGLLIRSLAESFAA